MQPDAFYSFITENSHKNPNELRLKYHGKDTGFNIELAITQIEARNKAKSKIPEVLENTQFMFPSALLAEQCTNEIIAKFHALLLSKYSNALDITAGLCIDSYYISKGCNVTAIEINPEAAAISAENMKALKANVTVINADSNNFIKENTSRRYDVIFADPARRDLANGERVYGFTDCQPDIINLMPHIQNTSDVVYIKSSPMIDITAAIGELKHVTEIWIIGIKNECKEILFKQEFTAIEPKNQIIHCVDFGKDGNIDSEYSFNYPPKGICDNICNDICDFNYLYEPNACVQKSGGINNLCSDMELAKANQNSQILLGTQYIEQFPGRKFAIEKVYDYNDRSIKDIRKTYNKLNITTRNFPVSTEQLRKKMKIQDGGDKYIFATTNKHQKAKLILCSKATM